MQGQPDSQDTEIFILIVTEIFGVIILLLFFPSAAKSLQHPFHYDMLLP